MEGRINESLLLTGQHLVSIQNISDQPNRYKYVYAISADNAKAEFTHELILTPYENFKEEGTSFVTFQSERAGVFESLVSTTISGAESYEFKNNGLIKIK